MIETTNFLPEWASPPGATISDFLEDQGRSIDDLARELGCPSSYTNRLLEGSIPITQEIASSLSQVLGATSDFWLARERQFRESLSRQSVSEKWVKEIPVADMTRYGWLRQAQDTRDKINACLEYFDVPTVTEWYERYEGATRLAAFRTSTAFTSAEGAVLAWLRKGEIDAANIECEEWDRKRFSEALPYIRALSRTKDPSKFIPQLESICAECGVAVVIAKAPAGCRASGATRFIAPNKALVMLSFRYLSDDHFWFTFFHEAGHLILHDTSALFLEGSDFCSGNEEEEANSFSSNTLVPMEHQSAMRALPVDGRAVMRFAREIGISPGIVVGQLQHLGILSARQLNNLKVRYSWS